MTLTRYSVSSSRNISLLRSYKSHRTKVIQYNTASDSTLNHLYTVYSFTTCSCNIHLTLLPGLFVNLTSAYLIQKLKNLIPMHALRPVQSSPVQSKYFNFVILLIILLKYKLLSFPLNFFPPPCALWFKKFS